MLSSSSPESSLVSVSVVMLGRKERGGAAIESVGVEDDSGRGGNGMVGGGPRGLPLAMDRKLVMVDGRAGCCCELTTVAPGAEECLACSDFGDKGSCV